MSTIRTALRALALLTLLPAVMRAQSDFGSSVGAGAGATGSIATPGYPVKVNTIRGTNVTPGTTYRAYTSTAASFRNAGSAMTISNPAGGTVSLPQEQARALGQIIGHPGASPEAIAEFKAALGSTPGYIVEALITRLMTADGNTSRGIIDSVAAYDAAITALPAGTSPSPMLLAIRSYLAVGLTTSLR